MDVWDWITQTNFASVVSGLGLGSLAIMFATDRILTKGQHDRRILDLKKTHEREVTDLEKHHKAEMTNLKSYHAAEIAEKEHQRSEMKESRNYYRDAYNLERASKDELSSKFSEVSVELVQLGDHLTSTFKEVGEAPDDSARTRQ